MNGYTEDRRRRIEQFAEYLRLMSHRRHEVVKDDDCYIIFDETAPDGVDAPNVEESASVKVGCLADGGPAPGEGDTEEPSPHDWSPPKPFRYVQFAFCEDCYYLELTNNIIFPSEAELILQQRNGFYWAKNRPDLPWVRANWKDMLRWNPLQKVYIYGDEHSAAEDLAFIIFTVWKFPVDASEAALYVTAASFHSGHCFERGKRIE